MFERYTEKARRVIFFARYEASQFGSPYIESEHLLLGLVREDKALNKRFLRPGAIDDIRSMIEAHTQVRKKVSTSVDLPLSNENKRVLAYAAEEAERLAHMHIGTEHLLLGLLREHKCFAAEILHDQGLTLSIVREALASAEVGEQSTATEGSLLRKFETDLVGRAALAPLPPVIGREAEVNRLIQVLGRSTKSNPVLVGPRGVGRRTIVTALAQRIDSRQVPASLAAKKIVAVDMEAIMTARRLERGFAANVAAELTSVPDTVYLIDEFYSLLLFPPEQAWLHASELLKTELLEGRIQCISIATPEENRRATEAHPWLSRCFTEIEVAEPSLEDATTIVMGSKERFGKYHSVTYSDDVVRYAVTCAANHVKGRALPEKVLDLIDEAGSLVRTQISAAPQEIMEARKKLRETVKAMEDAIANHEFAKARFYSEQERAQREQLRQLNEKHGIEKPAEVTREIIERVVASWTGIPVSSIRGSEPDASSHT